MRFSSSCLRLGEQGQATVEAAFLLPVLCAVLALFLQPAFLLYDRCVMQAAAFETCRVAATSTSDGQALEAYAIRRLGAVPNLGVFHSGEWQVEVASSGELGSAQVVITNRVQPLPLVGMTAGLLAYRLSGGSFEMKTEASTSTAPSWARSLGTGPQDWISEWE